MYHTLVAFSFLQSYGYGLCSGYFFIVDLQLLWVTDWVLESKQVATDVIDVKRPQSADPA